MQRAGQSADRRGHHRIGVGEGAGGDPGAERTGVETVFGVENQAGIKDAGRQGVRFPLGEHVKKIGAIGQIIAGLNRILAFANQLKGRHHGGNLGDQPNHSIDDVLRVVEGAARIEESQGGGTGLEGIHRMARGREAFHHVPNAEADPPVHLHIVFKIPQLKNCRQLAPDQEIGRFEKAAVLGQLLKGIAPVGEQAPVAVDRTDG